MAEVEGWRQTSPETKVERRVEKIRMSSVVWGGFSGFKLNFKTI